MQQNNTVLLVFYLMLIITFDGLVQLPFLLGILLKLGNDLYRTNPLTVLLLNKYFLRLLHLFLALALFLQVFLRVRPV